MIKAADNANGDPHRTKSGVGVGPCQPDLRHLLVDRLTDDEVTALEEPYVRREPTYF